MMFYEDDDGFDLSEQAILQATLDIENLAGNNRQRNNTTCKRRSFELQDVTNARSSQVQCVQLSGVDQQKKTACPESNKFSFPSSTSGRSNAVENLKEEDNKCLSSEGVRTVGNHGNNTLRQSSPGDGNKFVLGSSCMVPTRAQTSVSTVNPIAGHTGAGHVIKTPAKNQMPLSAMFQTSPDFDEVLASPPTWKPVSATYSDFCVASSKPTGFPKSNDMNIGGSNNEKASPQICVRTTAHSTVSHCATNNDGDDFDEDPALLKGLLDEDFCSFAEQPSRSDNHNNMNTFQSITKHNLSAGIKPELQVDSQKLEPSKTGAYSASSGAGKSEASSIMSSLRAPVTASFTAKNSDCMNVVTKVIPKSTISVVKGKVSELSASSSTAPLQHGQASTSIATKPADQSRKRKRKFPGPAGALPKRPPSSLGDLSFSKPVSPEKPVIKPPPSSQDVAGSQSGEDAFNDRPWQTMKAELEQRARTFLQQFSIAAVLKKAAKKQLVRGKVPIICVMIDSVSTHSDDASVGLKDPSGYMKGTIHRHLMKEYLTQLVPGTVLVLKQVGVFSPMSRNHYLNITPNNVVRLYCRDGQGGLDTHTLSQFTSEDFIIPEPPSPQHVETDSVNTPKHASPSMSGPQCASPNLPLRPRTPWAMTGRPQTVMVHPRGSPHMPGNPHPRTPGTNLNTSGSNPKVGHSGVRLSYGSNAPTRPMLQGSDVPYPRSHTGISPQGPQFANPSATRQQFRPRHQGNMTRLSTPHTGSPQMGNVKGPVFNSPGSQSAPQLRTVTTTAKPQLVGSRLISAGVTHVSTSGSVRLSSPIAANHISPAVPRQIGVQHRQPLNTTLNTPVQSFTSQLRQGACVSSAVYNNESVQMVTTAEMGVTTTPGRFSFKSSKPSSSTPSVALKGPVAPNTTKISHAEVDKVPPGGGRQNKQPGVQDLWQDQDDNLDDLLTDLQDEMMADF